MVRVTQIGQSLTLATLISQRCRDRGWSQAEFVCRVGDHDIHKGIHLLHQLFELDRTGTRAQVKAISTALDLPEYVVSQAAELSQELLDDRRHRQLELKMLASRTCKSARRANPSLRLISR